jgi:ATP-dependent Clp protease ATP-binding subunit ClpA
MTSNIGSEYIIRLQKIGFRGQNAQAGFSDVKDKITESLKNHFRPEFLNRLDEVIIFNPLSESTIREIVEIQLGLVKARLKGKNIALEVTADAISYLAKEGYSPEYGARPLKRIIQNKILNPVAGYIISKRVAGGSVVAVSIKNGLPVIDIKELARRKKVAIARQVNSVKKS